MNNKVIFQQLQTLLPKAICTYSKFHVAAILETDLGNFEGFNIENAAYPNSICAERVALFHALLKGAKKVMKIHLLTDNAEGLANMCGACRQSLSEHVAPEASVYVYAHNGDVRTFKFKDLLPESFNKQLL